MIAAHYFIDSLLTAEIFNLHILLLYIFMFGISVGIHAFLLNSLKKEAKKFIPAYMGATGIKMIVLLFTLLLYGLFNKESLVEFALSFMAIYVVFTSVETILIFKESKKKQ